MAKRKSGGRARRKAGRRESEGALEWFAPFIEETYFRLAPRADPLPGPPKRKPAVGRGYASSHAPSAGEAILWKPPRTVWVDRLRDFKTRKLAAKASAMQSPPAAAAPAAPGEATWLPLGPALLLNGQTTGRQPVAGRVSGIAIDRTGRILYAATASGGVFRSDDGGTSWRSLMDDFDVDPRDFASSSLACGAIAIHLDHPERVYVGTGEGDTHHLFNERIVDALPSYRGIGPIRSDDGGKRWVREPTADDSPDLAGDAFFALAVDPQNLDNVVAATTLGLYRRVPAIGGGFEWTRRTEGVYSSVGAVSSGGTTRFFAGKWGGGGFQSDDGQAWTPVGTGLPKTDVGRIALGAQPNNRDVLYAFVATKAGKMKGVYRLSSAVWRKLREVPDVLRGQGSYDLAIAVDPEDINQIYLGGDYIDDDNVYPGSIWRCVVRQDGSTFQVARRRSIGRHAHADVHVLTHTPDDPNELWCGCDGGMFLNRNPRGNGRFASHNLGLSCLCCNFIAQHPKDPNILFTGLQDNGTARTSSGPLWKCVAGGDGGYCVVNWSKPRLVLAFINGKVLRSKTGGLSETSWTRLLTFPFPQMTRPIVSAPFNEDHPGDADFVAVGAVHGVKVSKNFGNSWKTLELPLSAGEVFALAIASTERLFAGTTKGSVFRWDRSGTKWVRTRLDDETFEVTGLITDIAVDLREPNRDSVYVVFGGMGNDSRHVWRFDGTTGRWKACSGSGQNSLLDIEHNALVVDRKDPKNLYVGTDIGVWHSPDAGTTWNVMQNGLPDAPVFDLQLHPTQRLLRAALHGRGVYEIPVP